MSPIIFAHLEFLYRAQLCSFLIGFVTELGQVEGREDFEEFHDAKNSPEFSRLLRRRPAGSV